MASLPMFFQLTSPIDKVFFAVILPGVRVVSNRDEVWQDETKIAAADLVRPEQELYEWEVKPVDEGDVPVGWAFEEVDKGQG